MTTPAEQARDVGMANALRASRVTVWKFDAGRWIAYQPEGATFTADDLVAAVGLVDPSEGTGNNVVGAFISAQAKAGRIEWTGTFRKSERVKGHGNLQRVWRRGSLEGAEQAETAGSVTASAPSSEPGRTVGAGATSENLSVHFGADVESRTSPGSESPSYGHAHDLAAVAAREDMRRQVEEQLALEVPA